MAGSNQTGPAEESSNPPARMGNDSEHGGENSNPDYYYAKMSFSDIGIRPHTDSHAVFGPLWGEGLIERYDVYRRVDRGEKRCQGKYKRELLVVDLKLGSRLSGHVGVAHGGIISLIIDEAMGWACACLRQEGNEYAGTTAMTANLSVDYRAPLLLGTDAVVRVYHIKTQGRKMFFSAALESHDGNSVFAEASILMLRVQSFL